MLVLFRPTGVVETHSCCPVSFRCQFTPHASAHPIRVCAGHLQFKCRGWHVASYLARRRTCLVSLKLMEKYQNRNPFKYILYSAKIGEQTPAIAK